MRVPLPLASVSKTVVRLRRTEGSNPSPSLLSCLGPCDSCASGHGPQFGEPEPRRFMAGLVGACGERGRRGTWCCGCVPAGRSVRRREVGVGRWWRWQARRPLRRRRTCARRLRRGSAQGRSRAGQASRVMRRAPLAWSTAPWPRRSGRGVPGLVGGGQRCRNGPKGWRRGRAGSCRPGPAAGRGSSRLYGGRGAPRWS